MLADGRGVFSEKGMDSQRDLRFHIADGKYFVGVSSRLPQVGAQCRLYCTKLFIVRRWADPPEGCGGSTPP